MRKIQALQRPYASEGTRGAAVGRIRNSSRFGAAQRANSLVDLMGGEIGVDSAEGRGSTFWFTVTLPRAAPSTRQRITPVDVTGARVLIVDDNAVNRSILTEQMTSWTFDSCATESGAEGLKVLIAAAAYGVPVDCVVLDYQMPGMNGVEMARIVRNTASLADTPIIMLTSVDQSLANTGHHDLDIDAQLSSRRALRCCWKHWSPPSSGTVKTRWAPARSRRRTAPRATCRSHLRCRHMGPRPDGRCCSRHRFVPAPARWPAPGIGLTSSWPRTTR